MGGDFSDIFSDGIFEAPWELVVGVNLALQVLSWYENLPSDERPPHSIWWSDELLDQWFTDVEEKRNSRHGGGKGSSYDRADDAPMSENEFAAGLRPV